MPSNGARGPKAPPPVKFEDYVEQAIMARLQEQMTGPERDKAIGNAIRWAAVKARLLLPEHGAGFDDPDDLADS